MIFRIYCLPDTVLIVLNNTYSRKEPGSKRWLDNLYHSEDRVLKIKCNRPRRPRTCVQLWCSSHRKNVLSNPNLLGMFCLLIFLYNPLFIVSSHRSSLYVVALCFAALFSPKKNLFGQFDVAVFERNRRTVSRWLWPVLLPHTSAAQLLIHSRLLCNSSSLTFFRPNSLSAIHETHSCMYTVLLLAVVVTIKIS